MKRTRNQIAVILAAVLILAVAIAARAGYASLAQPPGKIELSATQFDWGTVPNTGPVSHLFQVRNVGPGPLEITGVSTSCGCTTAAVASTHLAPGETTELTVTFDPLAHDGATGQFLRVVYVRSDDPTTPEATLTFRVTVVEP